MFPHIFNSLKKIFKEFNPYVLLFLRILYILNKEGKGRGDYFFVSSIFRYITLISYDTVYVSGREQNKIVPYLLLIRETHLRKKHLVRGSYTTKYICGKINSHPCSKNFGIRIDN